MKIISSWCLDKNSKELKFTDSGYRLNENHLVESGIDSSGTALWNWSSTDSVFSRSPNQFTSYCFIIYELLYLQSHYFHKQFSSSYDALWVTQITYIYVYITYRYTFSCCTKRHKFFIYMNHMYESFNIYIYKKGYAFYVNT